MRKLQSYGRLAAGITTFVLMTAAPALAGSVSVSSNGVDSGTCGASSDPCATIGQAVTNAAQGDTIAVGPGVYAGTAIVDKAVTLVSSAGTGAATINTTMSLNFQGIELGKKGKGFHFDVAAVAVDVNGDEIVVRGNRFSDGNVGVQVNVATDVVIRDNSFDNAATGVLVDAGEATVVRGNEFGYIPTSAVTFGSTSTGAIVRENRTRGPSGAGFTIDGSGHFFFRNHIHGTPSGGFVSAGNPTDVVLQENLVVSGGGSPSYLLQTGSGWILTGNASVDASAPGFLLTAGTPLTLTGNVAIGGTSYGFLIANGTDHVLIGNSAIQNSDSGIVLGSVGAGVTITGGNLYGNGGSNCGLDNSSGSAILTTGVYWGASTGPGADPADAVCGNVPAVVVDAPAAVRAKVKMPGVK
jgi:nitrous oxidase accessory protein NosD